MKRREMLRAIGAMSLAPIAANGMPLDSNSGDTVQKVGVTKRRNSSADQIVLGDSHFLSKTNPIATADQRDLEALALQVIQKPEVQKARAVAAGRIKILAGRDATAEAWSSFEAAMDEWVFEIAMLAMNYDPNYPKVLGRHYGPPHEWFGMKVPGSRAFGGVNPDNNYTSIPIDENAHFELHGRRFGAGPTDVQITLGGNLFTTMTLRVFDWRDVHFNPDGTFVITLGPEPANGRFNYIQTGPDARCLFIRDTCADWRQMPNAYRIKRLDPPTAPPLTFQQLVDRAARHIADDIMPAYMFIASFNNMEVNTVTPPFASGDIAGLVAQRMSTVRLKLADDEAFVMTLGSGGAKYHVVPLNNYWVCLQDFWNNTSTMNSEQSLPNADGSTTYVISIRDPGVHNWIDTGGLHEPRLQIRWHVLPRPPVAGDGPWTKGKLVKLNDLGKELPAETKWVTPEERKQQLAKRLDEFNLRYIV